MEHCHLILDYQEHLFIVLFFPREVFFYPLEPVPKPGAYQPALPLAVHQERNKNCLELAGRCDGLDTFSASCGSHTPKWAGRDREAARMTSVSSLCFPGWRNGVCLRTEKRRGGEKGEEERERKKERWRDGGKEGRERGREERQSPPSSCPWNPLVSDQAA